MESIERILKDEHALILLAKKFSKCLQPGLVIYLQGNLGAGKTVFARGILHGLGYQGLVKSPTYSLVEPYVINQDFTSYHFDLYRLSDPEELEFTGSRDYFNAHSLCMIEWPEKARGHIPLADISCLLEYHDQGRKITLSACTDVAKHLMLQHVFD